MTDCSLQTGYGGLADVSAKVMDSMFKDNAAASSGAGIQAEKAATLLISGSTYEGNTVPQGNGGAVYSMDVKHFTILSSVFQRNAAGQGGALTIYQEHQDGQGVKVSLMTCSNICVHAACKCMWRAWHFKIHWN